MRATETAPLEAASTRPEPAELELSIVMPCLNEARTLGTCIEKALGFLSRHGVAGEVLVADNGSTDGSRELAERLGARVVPVSERGYGAALAGGIAAARGRYVIMADSDDSYDLGALMPILERLREGYGLVMGNRFRGGIAAGAMPLSHRYLGNPGLTLIGRLFFKSPCKDFYCGQRGFRRDDVLAMGLRSKGMEFALEMLVKATMMGLKITEVPVTLQPDGRDRAPHLRTWRDGWRSLRFFLHYSPRWTFLHPGLALIALGVLGGLLLVAGPRTVAGVTFDVHSLLYCAAAVTIGVQMVFLSIFGKMLAVATGIHPPNPRVERLVGKLSLEGGLVTGGLLFVLGLGLSIYAVAGWAGGGFGDLDPFREMRLVIPAVLALTLGAQVAVSSFFLHMLQHAQRREPVRA